MGVLSILRPVSTLCALQKRYVPFAVNHAKWMGTHKRVMVVQPTKFQWHKFKDALHFYIMLGVIPLTTLVFLVSVFVGPAELAEIPEGYEPEPWEYHKHPIQRWFARYIYASHQQDYEKRMFMIQQEEEKRQLRLLEWKIRGLMSERGDYQGWYYHPVTAKYLRQFRHQTKEAEESSGEF